MIEPKKVTSAIDALSKLWDEFLGNVSSKEIRNAIVVMLENHEYISDVTKDRTFLRKAFVHIIAKVFKDLKAYNWAKVSPIIHTNCSGQQHYTEPCSVVNRKFLQSKNFKIKFPKTKILWQIYLDIARKIQLEIDDHIINSIVNSSEHKNYSIKYSEHLSQNNIIFEICEAIDKIEHKNKIADKNFEFCVIASPEVGKRITNSNILFKEKSKDFYSDLNLLGLLGKQKIKLFTKTNFKNKALIICKGLNTGFSYFPYTIVPVEETEQEISFVMRDVFYVRDKNYCKVLNFNFSK